MATTSLFEFLIAGNQIEQLNSYCTRRAKSSKIADLQLVGEAFRERKKGGAGNQSTGRTPCNFVVALYYRSPVKDRSTMVAEQRRRASPAHKQTHILELQQASDHPSE